MYHLQLWSLGSPRPGPQQIWCLGRTALCFQDGPLLLCPLIAEGGRAKGAWLVRQPFHKALILPLKVEPLRPNPPKGLTSGPCCTGDSVSIWISEEHRHWTHSSTIIPRLRPHLGSLPRASPPWPLERHRRRREGLFCQNRKTEWTLTWGKAPAAWLAPGIGGHGACGWMPITFFPTLSWAPSPWTTTARHGAGMEES